MTSEPDDADTARPAPAPLPAGYTAVGRGSDAVPTATSEQASHEADDDADEPEAADDGRSSSAGNASLVATGIVAGIYALFTIGWVVGGLRMQTTAQFLIAPAVFWVNLWLAIAAPALWFATAWLLTRRSARWVRFVWLAAGVVLLVPWPFAMIGTVGQ